MLIQVEKPPGAAARRLIKVQADFPPIHLTGHVVPCNCWSSSVRSKLEARDDSRFS